MIKRGSESKEWPSSLDGNQDKNDSNGTATPSVDWKLGAFSLNAFDFASLQTSFKRVVDIMTSAKISKILEGSRFVLDVATNYLFAYTFYFMITIIGPMTSKILLFTKINEILPTCTTVSTGWYAFSASHIQPNYISNILSILNFLIYLFHLWDLILLRIPDVSW